MNCNIFVSCYHSYSITKDGKVFSKYENKLLTSYVKDGYNEVLFSFGTGKERLEQWFRVDWLVAMRYIPNENNYCHIKHKDGNNLNDSFDNLQWCEFCTEEPSKEIEGYRGKYIITSTGKVFNNWTGQQLKSRLNHGYPHIGLRVFDGKVSVQKLFKVHRLVATYFIDNPDNLPVVNHKDGNKENNNVDNLEWVSYSDNNNHAVKTNLRKSIWTKELATVAINLIENYRWSSNEVAELLDKSKSAVLYLYQKGYVNLNLKTSNVFVKKTSKYDKSLPISDTYRNYITMLLKDNTVLNDESKDSSQCND